MGDEHAPLYTASSHTECAVCLSEFKAPCRTPCGHVFCNECFRRTLKSQPPWNRGACPLCRTDVSLYNTVDVVSDEPLEKAMQNTIFGHRYLQNGEAGVAAYHFDSPDDCYISYENAPVQWLLEDGSRPPARKPFENAHYNEATRTFIGTINWSEATFGGDARWEYEMKFSDDFVVISGGQMTGFDRDGNQTRTHPFPEALRYVREYQLPKTIVGQAYMQGGGLGVASYHFPQIDQAYISYEAAPPEWSLDDGSRPPQRKPFDNPRYDETTRTFTGTIDWSETPFAGDARWEYEMIFSEDLTRITGGQVRTFHSSGAASMRGTSEFGRNLHYTLYIEEQAQLFHLFTLGFRARAAAVTGPSPQGSGLQQIRLAISSFIARTWSPRQFNTDARAPGDADADGLEPPSVQEPSAQGEQSASTSAPVAGEGMGDDDGSGGGRG